VRLVSIAHERTSEAAPVPKFSIQLNLYSADHVALMLEGLVQCNMLDLRTHPDLPDLYASGVRYVREKDKRNQWQGILEAYATKTADCEDLCAARVAICRIRLGDARARCICKFVRPGLWHILVKRGDGMIEDPSRILGMGQPTH
jgi:hypothetical protein